MNAQGLDHADDPGPAGAGLAVRQVVELRPEPLDREPLTAREAQIARLAADGLASKAIAEQLHLSVRTVEGHLGRVYDKLGVRSRAELVRALG